MIMDGEDVCAVSVKCGYDNVSSFLRAFKEFYGFTPNEVSNRENKLHTFTKAGLDVVVRGGVELDYKIVNLDEFYVDGVKGESDVTDTECCENVWQQFDLNDFKKNNPTTDKICAVYFNGENSVTCHIGKKTKEKKINSVLVPKSKWVMFSCKGFDDKIVNAFYSSVIYNFFESSGYVKKEKLPNLEIFPIDMEGNFVWDIYVPIV
jgi:AraC family transcriptional regulator